MYLIVLVLILVYRSIISSRRTLSCRSSLTACQLLSLGQSQTSTSEIWS